MFEKGPTVAELAPQPEKRSITPRGLQACTKFSFYEPFFLFLIILDMSILATVSYFPTLIFIHGFPCLTREAVLYSTDDFGSLFDAGLVR